ncbi:hypothetical protein ADUPG1_001773, partial [Aduncisulcus paluster]
GILCDKSSCVDSSTPPSEGHEDYGFGYDYGDVAIGSVFIPYDSSDTMSSEPSDEHQELIQLVDKSSLEHPISVLTRMIGTMSHLGSEIFRDALLKRMTHATYQRYRLGMKADRKHLGLSTVELPSLQLLRRIRRDVIQSHRLCSFASSSGSVVEFYWMTPLSSLHYLLFCHLNEFVHFTPLESPPTSSTLDGHPCFFGKYHRALKTYCGSNLTEKRMFDDVIREEWASFRADKP